MFIGRALRFGYALGLHIQHDDLVSSAAEREVISRIWWGHYALESTLAVVTGRPSIGNHTTCFVPLPLPIPSSEIEETIIESRFGDRRASRTRLLVSKLSLASAGSMDSPIRTVFDPVSSNLEPGNSGSYLKNVVQLGEIANEALSMYAASTVKGSWPSVQENIMRLTAELDRWASYLPDDLDFDKRGAIIGHKYEREKNTLEILFHSTKMLITRPCMCRLDRWTMNQRARLSEFNERMALTCVESAKSVARVLPNRPEANLVRLYQAVPFWNIVSTIMQSLGVLLLEAVYEASYSTHDGKEVMPSLKKLVRWLRAMRRGNEMADRAYGLVVGLLRTLVTKITLVSSSTDR
jgi:hypothetical protein